MSLILFVTASLMPTQAILILHQNLTQIPWYKIVNYLYQRTNIQTKQAIVSIKDNNVMSTAYSNIRHENTQNI